MKVLLGKTIEPMKKTMCQYRFTIVCYKMLKTI